MTLDNIQISLGRQNLVINNVTSYNIDIDFWLPVDAYTIEITDSNVDRLYRQMVQGDRIEIKINDDIVITGFVDLIQRSYDRNGGNSLILSGRNALGIVQDAKVNPNIQSTIKASTSYQNCFKQIFNQFGLDVILNLDEDLSKSAISTGGLTGQSQNITRTIGNQITKLRLPSAKKFIQHNIIPAANEGYLAYAQRIAKQIGCLIRMDSSGKNVIISPPSYTYVGEALNLNAAQPGTNILSGSLQSNFRELPSAIIAECNVSANNGNSKYQVMRVIKTNDIFGYDKNGVIIKSFTNLPVDVNNFFSYYKNIYESNLPNTVTQNIYRNSLQNTINDFRKKGAVILEPNNLVQANLPYNFTRLAYNLNNLPLRIEYIKETRVASVEELENIVQIKMANYYDKAVEVNYSISGHTQGGVLYYPDYLVNVNDDSLALVGGKLWLRRCNYTRSRSAGTKTNLYFTLPYTWGWNIEAGE